MRCLIMSDIYDGYKINLIHLHFVKYHNVTVVVYNKSLIAWLMVTFIHSPSLAVK